VFNIYWLGLIVRISIVGDVDFLRLTICFIQIINFNIQNYKAYYKKVINQIIIKYSLHIQIFVTLTFTPILTILSYLKNKVIKKSNII
jgi:hypothetical protein